MQFGDILPPKNWQDIKIKMAFNGNNQPQIEVDEVVLVNSHIPIVQNQLDTAGIFEGLDFDINQTENGITQYFIGYLDLTTLEWDAPYQCRAKFKQRNSIDLLDDKFRALSFGFLADKGNIDKGDYVDVPTIVQKKFDGVEVAFASLGVFIITKTILETRKQAAEDLSFAAAALVPGSVSVALLIKNIATIIYIVAYYALLVIALINMLKSIKENLLPKKVNYKGIRLKTAIEKALLSIGFRLDCDIEDLHSFVYLPSKTNPKSRANQKDEGIPNAQDFGYTLAEMMELVFDLFDAKFTIIDDVVYIRNQYSPFWFNTSTNIFPSHIDFQKYGYNASEMFANFVLRFQYDSSDEHTLPSVNKHADDYSRGTNFEVITDFDNGGDKMSKMNKGLKEISLPVALGRRRNRLSTSEELLKGMFAIADTLIKILGGGTPFRDAINENKGCLLISQNSFNTSKLIYLDKTGYIPPYHRDYLSASSLWRNYYIYGSFVQNAPQTQRLIFKDVKIPMNFSTFIAYKNSPYFTIESDNSPFSGKRGKLTNFEWVMGSNSAQVDFYIEDEYVKSNLKETYIET